MSARITVVDYGVGNLYSVRRALEYCGATDISISSRVEDVLDAERLILPGVGAFADGMQGLRSRGLVEPITHYAKSGRPLLGICLGMQMLASESEEFGRHEGLNLIPGRVVPIPRFRHEDGSRLKVPFIGWTPLLPHHATFMGGCLKDMSPSGAVYLVHSFHLVPVDEANVLATYRHGTHAITAAVRHGNITGLQFHPEKSGKVGLRVISNFIAGP